MGHMLHRAVHTAFEQKVFLATPAYSGVEAGYAFALFESVKALEGAGIGSELALFANDCHVDDSRNRLVRQFLMTDCTDLIFLDSDLRWEAKDLVKLCQFDADVVGGTYPLKQEKEDYPVRLIGGEVNGLIEAEALPTGFLRIKRHVLEALANDAPKYYGKKDNHIPTPLIFERTLEGTARWGGDYTFCKKWRAAGGQLFLYPSPCFEHIGSKVWCGSFEHFQNKQEKGAIHAGLDAIRSGRVTPEAVKDMYTDWGNEWAGDADLLATAALLAPGKTVLECGSGLSTLCMLAAGATVHSLEHDFDYALKTSRACSEYLTSDEAARLHMTIAPIVDGWYGVTDFPNVDMLVCDGPPRAISNRLEVSRVLPKLNGPMLVDDFSPEYNALPFTWHKLTERVSIGNRTASH